MASDLARNKCDIEVLAGSSPSWKSNKPYAMCSRSSCFSVCLGELQGMRTPIHEEGGGLYRVRCDPFPSTLQGFYFGYNCRLLQRVTDTLILVMYVSLMTSMHQRSCRVRSASSA